MLPILFEYTCYGGTFKVLVYLKLFKNDPHPLREKELRLSLTRIDTDTPTPIITAVATDVYLSRTDIL